MASIAKVQVPTDFGIEYLRSPSHGNLKFLLKSGEELLANSTVMSFNSPMIKKLTSENGQTTAFVDASSFSKDAVQCFLEASYSGNIKTVSKSTFRDVNSMCHAFQVKWLAEKCFTFFQSQVNAVKHDQYGHQLYVFEEAMFVLDTHEKRNFMETVIKRFSSQRTCTQHFVINYLTETSPRSIKSLDVIIEMTAKQEHILVDFLVGDFEKTNSSLSENSRYILERLDFTVCQPTYESSYKTLLEKLENIENPSTEDYRLIVKILRQSNNALKRMRDSTSYTSLPNLFHDFQLLKDLNDPKALTAFVVESTSTKNSFITFDAVYCWLLENQSDGSPCLSVNHTFLRTLLKKLSKNGWGPLARKYIEHKAKSWAGGLTENIQQNPKLVTEKQYYITRSVCKYTPDELFSRDHQIKFKLKDKPDRNCSEAGDCGFILRVTAESGAAPFNIQLVTDPTLYSADIHLHKEDPLVSPGSLHLALDVTNHNGNANRPVTWYGKPCRDGTNKYWCWGPYQFYKKGEGAAPAGYIYEQFLFYGSNVKIRPVVYIFD